MTVSPEEPPPPHAPSWGCLMALIAGTLGLTIAVVLAVKLIDTALTGVTIR